MVVLEAVVQQADVSVVWYKNERTLETSKLHEIIQKGDVHQLVLRGLSASAEFKIKAVNAAGESYSSCSVIVRPKPKPKVCTFSTAQKFYSYIDICMNDVKIDRKALNYCPCHNFRMAFRL